jgi:hypothetical protein
MSSAMTFALRHPLSIVFVLAALAATVIVFTFARPQDHPRYESKMIDFSQVRYYSPPTVRRAFAEDQVRLRFVSRFSGIEAYSNRRLPFDADQLQVMVGPSSGRGSWGPKLEPYDERFGNVLVTYGGNDEQLLERVKAAVSALRTLGA